MHECVVGLLAEQKLIRRISIKTTNRISIFRTQESNFRGILPLSRETKPVVLTNFKRNFTKIVIEEIIPEGF